MYLFPTPDTLAPKTFEDLTATDMARLQKVWPAAYLAVKWLEDLYATGQLLTAGVDILEADLFNLTRIYLDDRDLCS